MLLKDPRGIEVNNAGNVHIVSNSQHKLMVISADGQRSRQILSKDDGLKDTRAISYEKIKCCLCV